MALLLEADHVWNNNDLRLRLRPLVRPGLLDKFGPVSLDNFPTAQKDLHRQARNNRILRSMIEDVGNGKRHIYLWTFIEAKGLEPATRRMAKPTHARSLTA